MQIKIWKYNQRVWLGLSNSSIREQLFFNTLEQESSNCFIRGPHWLAKQLLKAILTLLLANGWTLKSHFHKNNLLFELSNVYSFSLFILQLDFCVSKAKF